MKSLWIVLFLVSCSPVSYAIDNSASGTSAKIDVERLVSAIGRAENSKRHPYGILSVKCNGEKECRQICKNTVKNNLKRWAKSTANGSKIDFIPFLGSKYAPNIKGLKNDPTGLNSNWVKNVTYFYNKGAK